MSATAVSALRFAAVLSFTAVISIASAQSSPPKNPLRVTTNEVTVPVTVTDRTGELVLDLSKADFHVFDNSVEQPIDHWELSGNPLAVALVIDTSSHLHPLAAPIHSMGIIFTDTVMALDSEAAVRLLQTQPASWRRIMLVVGESRDSGSLYTLGDVVRQAEQADITIYVVGASSVGADLRGNKLTVDPLKIRGLPPITAVPCGAKVPHYGDSSCFDLATPAMWLLERGTSAIKHHQLAVAAAATGGADFSGFRESALQDALDRIGGELHAQYILGFNPRSDSPPGLHSLRVAVDRRDVAVRARPGYFLTHSTRRPPER